MKCFTNKAKCQLLFVDWHTERVSEGNIKEITYIGFWTEFLSFLPIPILHHLKVHYFTQHKRDMHIEYPQNCLYLSAPLWNVKGKKRLILTYLYNIVARLAIKFAFISKTPVYLRTLYTRFTVISLREIKAKVVLVFHLQSRNETK